MLIVLWVIFAIIVVSIILSSGQPKEVRDIEKTNREKGEKLEERVYNRIKENAEEEGCYERYIRNAYIPVDKKNTTEIDLIVINEKGISVFEDKYRTGNIGNVFTNPKDEYWDCEHVHQNSRRKYPYKLYNPIKQNYNHIYALKKYLNNNGFQSTNNMRNYVVFGENASLANSIYYCKFNGKVYRYDDEVGFRYRRNVECCVKEACYTKEEIDAIADFLEKNCCNISKRARKKHIKYVAQMACTIH